METSQVDLIALATSGEDLLSPLDQRFGRAKNFLIFDLRDNSFTVVANSQSLNIAQGAGIQTAQNIVGTGAQSVIGGHCGPKAFRVLNAAGIQVYACDKATVQEAIDMWKEGKLSPMKNADVEGHWV